MLRSVELSTSRQVELPTLRQKALKKIIPSFQRDRLPPKVIEKIEAATFFDVDPYEGLIKLVRNLKEESLGVIQKLENFNLSQFASEINREKKSFEVDQPNFFEDDIKEIRRLINMAKGRLVCSIGSKENPHDFDSKVANYSQSILMGQGLFNDKIEILSTIYDNKCEEKKFYQDQLSSLRTVLAIVNSGFSQCKTSNSGVISLDSNYLFTNVVEQYNWGESFCDLRRISSKELFAIQGLINEKIIYLSDFLTKNEEILISYQNYINALSSEFAEVWNKTLFHQDKHVLCSAIEKLRNNLSAEISDNQIEINAYWGDYNDSDYESFISFWEDYQLKKDIEGIQCLNEYWEKTLEPFYSRLTDYEKTFFHNTSQEELEELNLELSSQYNSQMEKFRKEFEDIIKILPEELGIKLDFDESTANDITTYREIISTWVDDFKKLARASEAGTRDPQELKLKYTEVCALLTSLDSGVYDKFYFLLKSQETLKKLSDSMKLCNLEKEKFVTAKNEIVFWKKMAISFNQFNGNILEDNQEVSAKVLSEIAKHKNLPSNKNLTTTEGDNMSEILNSIYVKKTAEYESQKDLYNRQVAIYEKLLKISRENDFIRLNLENSILRSKLHIYNEILDILNPEEDKKVHLLQQKLQNLEQVVDKLERELTSLRRLSGELVKNNSENSKVKSVASSINTGFQNQLNTLKAQLAQIMKAQPFFIASLGSGLFIALGVMISNLVKMFSPSSVNNTSSISGLTTMPPSFNQSQNH
ncbi:MAG: hypothetical protein QNJ31_01365 [Candidatus Caenarcaniphilales bacterium]|nr:hypothetical protein [Candidatus Caenarcaniphilales bacterium]